jgi:integrase
VIDDERHIEMRVEQVYRQSLQMAHFVANRCHTPRRTAAGIEDGRLLRSVSKSGKVQIGIEHFGAHDLRRTCAKLCRKNGGDLQLKFLLGHSSIQTTERYLGSEQDIEIAVNDDLGLSGDRDFSRILGTPQFDERGANMQTPCTGTSLLSAKMRPEPQFD